MTPAEFEQEMRAQCEKWAKATRQKWPPDPGNFYSFSEFWTWLGQDQNPFTGSIVEWQARRIAEPYFEGIMLQSWRS